MYVHVSCSCGHSHVDFAQIFHQVISSYTKLAEDIKSQFPGLPLTWKDGDPLNKLRALMSRSLEWKKVIKGLDTEIMPIWPAYQLCLPSTRAEAVMQFLPALDDPRALQAASEPLQPMEPSSSSVLSALDDPRALQAASEPLQPAESTSSSVLPAPKELSTHQSASEQLQATAPSLPSFNPPNLASDGTEFLNEDMYVSDTAPLQQSTSLVVQEGLIIVPSASLPVSKAPASSSIYSSPPPQTRLSAEPLSAGAISPMPATVNPRELGDPMDVDDEPGPIKTTIRAGKKKMVMTVSLPARRSQPKKGVPDKGKGKAKAKAKVTARESEDEEEGPSDTVQGALQRVFDGFAESGRHSTPSPAPVPAQANYLDACNSEATALICQGHTTASGLTSEEGSRLLGAFLTLSPEERRAVLSLPQAEVALAFKGLVTKKRGSVKYTRSPKHKRLRCDPSSGRSVSEESSTSL